MAAVVAAGGAFLKLGSLGFGLGAEKNDESDLASLTAVTTGLVSFLTTTGFDDDAVPTADFFVGGGAFEGVASLNFRFFDLTSKLSQETNSQGRLPSPKKKIDVAHPQ
jgi:hypothetical protein